MKDLSFAIVHQRSRNIPDVQMHISCPWLDGRHRLQLSRLLRMGEAKTGSDPKQVEIRMLLEMSRRESSFEKKSY